MPHVQCMVGSISGTSLIRPSAFHSALLFIGQTLYRASHGRLHSLRSQQHVGTHIFPAYIDYAVLIPYRDHHKPHIVPMSSQDLIVRRVYFVCCMVSW